MMVDEWGQKPLKEKGGIEGTGRRGGRTGKKEAKERNRGTARNRPGGQKGEKRRGGGCGGGETFLPPPASSLGPSSIDGRALKVKGGKTRTEEGKGKGKSEF